MGSGPFEEAIWTLNEIKKLGLGFLPSDMKKFECSQIDTNSVRLNFINPKDTVIDGNTILKIFGVKIMMRDDRYPENPYDGTVVFDSKNTESTEIDSTTGEQSYVVTGLDREKTYYFTCYPYGARDVFNETNSPENRSTVYVAGDETVTVNVTVDNPDLFPYVNITLNDVTDPTLNITKPINPNSSETFKATIFHQYYISSEQIENFSNPSNTETFTAVGDGSRIVDFNYMFAANIIRVNVTTDDEDNSGGFSNKQVSVTAKNISKSTQETVTKIGGGEYLFAAINGDTYEVIYEEVEDYAAPESSGQFTMVAGTEEMFEGVYSYGELLSLVVKINVGQFIFNWGEFTQSMYESERRAKINEILKNSNLSLPVDITDMATNKRKRAYIPVNRYFYDYIGGVIGYRFKVGTSDKQFKYKIKPLPELFKPSGYPSKFFPVPEIQLWITKTNNGDFYLSHDFGNNSEIDLYNTFDDETLHAEGSISNRRLNIYLGYANVNSFGIDTSNRKQGLRVTKDRLNDYTFSELKKILLNHQPSMYYPKYIGKGSYDINPNLNYKYVADMIWSDEGGSSIVDDEANKEYWILLEAGCGGERDTKGNLINKADKFYAIFSSTKTLGYYKLTSGSTSIYNTGFDNAASSYYSSHMSSNVKSLFDATSTKKQGYGTSLAHTYNGVLGYPPTSWYGNMPDSSTTSNEILKCFPDLPSKVEGLTGKLKIAGSASGVTAIAQCFYAISHQYAITSDKYPDPNWDPIYSSPDSQYCTPGTIVTISSTNRQKVGHCFRVYVEVGNATRNQCKSY